MFNPSLIRMLALPLIIIMLQSCSKDDAPNPTPPAYGDELTSIEWTTGLQKETYEYNPNKTLKRIIYSTGQVANTYEFTWNGNNVTAMYEKDSDQKNFYYYAGGRVSYMTNSPFNDPSTSHYKMEYTYRPDGKVDKLKYFIINASGAELKAATSYHYNTAGDLAYSVTHMDEYMITQTIEGYSQPVRFNPWGFIDLTLLENYMIFNYPVLSTMKGFPAKITRSVKINNDPEFVDIITTHTCEISNNRINKMVVEKKIPSSPSLDRTRTAIFNYK